MKRFLVLLTCVSCINVLLKAEQPAICGDWIDRQQETSYGDYGDISHIAHIKILMRIKFSDSNYFVFEKIQREDNEGISYVNYLGTGKVTAACQDSISWYRTSIRWKNGNKEIEEEHRKAVFMNGVLEVSEYTHTTNYDKNGNVVNTHKSRERKSTYYRYDQDW